MVDEHHCAAGILSQPLPPLGDGVDCLVGAFADGMARHERVNDHRGDLPFADRRGELHKYALRQCEAVAVFDRSAKRLDQPAIEMQSIAAIIGTDIVECASGGQLPLQFLGTIL